MKRTNTPTSADKKLNIAEPTTPEAIYAKWESLAYKFTSGWSIAGYAPEDLQQEARIAIFRCAQVFEPSRGCFYTIAERAIRNRLASILTRSRAKKRVASVQSLDELAYNNSSDSLHEMIPEGAIDPTMPRGVAIREVLQGHIDRKRENLEAKRSSRKRVSRKEVKEGREVGATLDLVHEAYGIEPSDFRMTRFIAGADVCAAV